MTLCKICGFPEEVRKEIEDAYRAMVSYKDICANINRKYQLNLNAPNISHHRHHDSNPPTELGTSPSQMESKFDIHVDISEVPAPNAFEIVENGLKRLLAIEKERGFLTAEEIRERTTLLGFHIQLDPNQSKKGETILDWQKSIDEFKANTSKIDTIYPRILAGEPEIGPRAKRILVEWDSTFRTWFDIQTPTAQRETP